MNTDKTKKEEFFLSVFIGVHPWLEMDFVPFANPDA